MGLHSLGPLLGGHLPDSVLQIPQRGGWSSQSAGDAPNSVLLGRARSGPFMHLHNPRPHVTQKERELATSYEILLRAKQFFLMSLIHFLIHSKESIWVVENVAIVLSSLAAVWTCMGSLVEMQNLRPHPRPAPNNRSCWKARNALKYLYCIGTDTGREEMFIN